MSVAKEINSLRNFTIWNGGFGGGLFNSINGSLIPDNCLADISNLHIDHFGNLHSVGKPTQSTDCYATALSGSIRALIPTSGNMYINRNGTMYNELNQGTVWTVDTITTQVSESPATIGFRQWVTYNDGLWDSGTNITAADQDFDIGSLMSSTITEFEGRVVFNMANLLRWSDLTNPALEETWRGPKDPVDLTTMTLANTLFFIKMPTPIRKLQKCRGSLYVFCENGIYASPTLDVVGGTGSIRLVYFGAYLPKFGTGAPFTMYSDGLAIYYICNNKLIAFDGSNANLISDRLNLPSTLAGYAGEYDNRLWFLLCTEAQPDGAVANAMYAIDKTTGAWEKYSIARTSLNDSATETPTAMSAGNDPVVGIRGDRLWIGTNLGRVYYFTPTDTSTPLPWSFTTKTYTPSFDAYSRFVHFKIRYVGQALTSPVTITQHVCRDGIDSTSDVILTRASATLDMVGSGGGMFQKDIECKAAKGEGVYFTVSGTGTCEIADVGTEFSTTGAGDVNA
jgi:hypothetical protein